MSFLHQNLKLPKDFNCEKIKILFSVEKDGRVQDIEVKQNGKIIENFDITPLEKMPRWKPEMIKGKPVRVFFSIPVIVECEN